MKPVVRALACVLAVVLAALAATLPDRAHACGNSYVSIYVLPEGIRRAEAIERLVARGDSRAAYRAARELSAAVVGGHALDRRGEILSSDVWYAVEPEDGLELPETEHADGASALELRARMLEAILTIRLDGQITRDGRPARRVHENVRMDHLTEARNALALLLSEHPDVPRLAAYHAEALARIDPAHADEARDTLRDLATRDLLGDPLSWAALASLETEEAAREAALGHCRTIVSRRAEAVCVVRGA